MTFSFNVQGHYRYAQAFFELGKTERAKEVNRNGLAICRSSPQFDKSGQSVSYLQVQAEKFSQKESEEDEVPELVEASSSNSESGDSDMEDDDVQVGRNSGNELKAAIALQCKLNGKLIAALMRLWKKACR